jgi:AcrR family transcriptional regulator
MVTKESRFLSKRRMSGEDRRSQIVSIAAELFSRNGFNGTTTRQIAEQAGVSEAIIFRHFQNKQELYSAIIDHKSSECLTRLWSNCEDAMRRRDDRAVFVTIAIEILDLHREDPTLLRLLYYSALEGHELSKMFFNTTVRIANERISEYVKQRIEDGLFREVDPISATRAFFSLVAHRAVVRELFQDDELRKRSSREAAEEITDLLLNGLLRR